MRILYVTPWLAERYGGPAILVPQAAAALTRRGHEVEIFTTPADGHGVLDVPTGEVIDWGGAAVTFHPLSRPRWYATSWSLLANLRRRISTFDIVHIHYLYRFHGLAAALVARANDVPYVVQAHGSLDPKYRGQKRRAKDVYHALVEDRILAGAASIISTSERERSFVRDLGLGVSTWVIPIGIDTEELRLPGTPQILEAAAIRLESRVVTFLGRIAAKKGVALVVDSFRRTAASIPLAHLVIAGPDDEGVGRDLAAQIAGTDLARRISFVGAISGPAKRALLQRSDVFVLPSESESFGIAVAEAMAVGCPVVVSPQVAIADVVQSSGAGIVAERNPAAIAEAVQTILADPTGAKAMGEAGRRVVDERFAWPVVAEQLESMYQAIVGVSRRRSAVSTVAGRKSPVPTAYICPRCGGSLTASGDEWRSACGWRSSSVGGVPILLPDAALAEHDELDHHQPPGHKTEQAAHFDRADHETFETERPHGSPRLYRFLLGEKFRRAVGPVRLHLAGASALTVCGGSGIDADYLSRAGATVITSDLSLGAATRAMTRSARFGLGIQSIVADVEHLPFPDESIDLVAVHDGLHHLADPYAGLGEMARVARRWVVVSEPARAAVTRLAIRLGLALEREEAGNRVARMDPSEIAAYLEARGFVVLHTERYAMYYPHHPGRLFTFLSRTAIYPVVRTAWRIANAMVGRFGNKMVVVAERVPSLEAVDQGAAP